MEELISQDGEVIMTKWFDNKPLHMASTFMGIGDADKCKRWDKNKKEYVYVSRPEVVKVYNACMGGVDKMDFLIQIYRTFIRSKKWTLRLFTHALDIACTNAWLEYKEKAIQLGIPKRDVLDLLHFRAYIAEALILADKTTSRKRGRPSRESTPTVPTFSRGTQEVRPIREVRYDGQNHWPIHEDKKSAMRCKNPGCKKQSRILCNKCKVHLCLNKSSNCFISFHNS